MVCPVSREKHCQIVAVLPAEQAASTFSRHPAERCGRRRWSGLQPVVGDFDHGYSVWVPPRGAWHLRWHMRLTCSDALSGRPRTADPGEKTSVSKAIAGALATIVVTFLARNDIIIDNAAVAGLIEYLLAAGLGFLAVYAAPRNEDGPRL